MNIKNIPTKDIHMTFTLPNNSGVICYAWSLGKVVVHNFNQEGECYQGDYIPASDVTTIKEAFLHRVTKELNYFSNN